MSKKSNLFHSLRIPALLLGAAQCVCAFEIALSEQFQTTIEPDHMRSSIGVTYESTDQQKIKFFYDTLLLKAKNGQTACRGGSYSISPRYNYQSNPREFIGFRGQIRFNCTFSDTKAFDTSLKLIEQNMDPHLQKISQSGISWQSSPEIITKGKESLKKEAIEYGMHYARSLEEITHLSCALQKIDTSNHSSAVRPMMEMAMDSRALKSTEAPIKESHTLQLSASYLYNCQ